MSKHTDSDSVYIVHRSFPFDKHPEVQVDSELMLRKEEAEECGLTDFMSDETAE